MDDRTQPDPELLAPTILDRSRHSLSRRDIDPDALKVLYRLSSHGFIAYLVGGAVRDLLLRRRPADFDVGTDAHPNQIKKLFRNAFLIGRRFRLAHVRFQGGKVVEVSTFRRKPDDEELAAEREEQRLADEAARAREAAIELPPAEAAGAGDSAPSAAAEHPASPVASEAPAAHDEPGAPPAPSAAPPEPPRRPVPIPGRPPLRPIAFGTPREDAFRRDITINALFYDISTYSVIDYVGGLDDLRLGRIRVIGDPGERFTEDPVRIWRVIRHASRLGFTIEEATERAIAPHLPLLAKAAGSRLCEELNKDLKKGASRAFFELARHHALLPVILGRVGEAYQRSDEAFGRLAENLAAIDAAVSRGSSPSPDMVYALLLWPWAKPVLAGAQGDKARALYDAFREAKAAATIPKGVLLDAVQTLVIVDQMLEALATGRMRWGVRKRAHYSGAAKIASFLVQGTFGQGEDPFAKIFGARFRVGHEAAHGAAEGADEALEARPEGETPAGEAGLPAGRPRRRRRRRRPRRRPSAPQAPAA